MASGEATVTETATSVKGSMWDWFKPEHLWTMGRVILIALVILFLVRLLSFAVRRVLQKRLADQAMMLISKGINYTGFTLVALWVLGEMGVEMSALLGAAGIVGVALGIASQTSLGNIISGFFLISEKPFAISDIITVGEYTGYVHSIDLLSIKIRTFDNLFIRIPNQEIISTNVVNLTRFPIRRLNISIQLSFDEDLNVAEEILMDIVKSNPLCLTEPEPFILYQEFSDNGIKLLFALWFELTDFLAVKNSVYRAVHQRFKDEGIRMPYPHRIVVYPDYGETKR